MTERKFKKVQKYHYKMVKICEETDKVFTRCYSCGEWKESGTENFRKEASPDRDRDFRPLCKKCANAQLKEYMHNRKKQKELEKMKYISTETIHSEPLIKETKEEKSLESKIQRILDYL